MGIKAEGGRRERTCRGLTVVAIKVNSTLAVSQENPEYSNVRLRTSSPK
jgi:hypothetical protein